MDFTYTSYQNLLTTLDAHGYTRTDYHHWQEVEKPVILRHDIDTDVDAAVEFARREFATTGGRHMQHTLCC